MTGRRAWVVGLIATLLIAGVGSWYASHHPDGLEYVAEQTGFADQGRDSATSKGPLADYRTRGIADDRWSTGIAGVAGTLVVLGLSLGLFWGLRKRRPDRDSETA